MAKPKQKVVTRGVQGLGLDPMLLQLMFRKAESFYPKHDFLVFDPSGGRVTVGDGDGKKLDEIQTRLPEKVWLKTDDYGHQLVITALLPSEY